MHECDPGDMLLFAKVVELGSLSAAARVTLRPKATLSRAVSRLEDQLQVRLLERSSRRASVTEAGRLFYQYCSRVANTVEEAQHALGALQGTVQGTLKIGSSLTIGQTMLTALVPDFVSRHPQLRVRLELTNRDIDLLEESFDVVLKVGPLPNSNLVATELATIHYGLFASPAFLSRFGRPQHPRELQGALVVDNFGGRASAEWRLIRDDVACQVQVSPRLDFNDAIMRREAVVKSAGIGMIPRWVCNAAVHSGKLEEVLPEWRSDRVVHVYALSANRRHAAPRLRAFLDHLSEGLPPLLAANPGR